MQQRSAFLQIPSDRQPQLHSLLLLLRLVFLLLFLYSLLRRLVLPFPNSSYQSIALRPHTPQPNAYTTSSRRDDFHVICFSIIHNHAQDLAPLLIRSDLYWTGTSQLLYSNHSTPSRDTRQAHYHHPICALRSRFRGKPHSWDDPGCREHVRGTLFTQTFARAKRLAHQQHEHQQWQSE